MRWGAIFPGQGSQVVGMGRFLFDNFKSARMVYEEASDAIAVDLRKLCFDGDDTALNLTENTQPALLATSVATFRSLAEIADLSIHAGAGHSIGEYAALVSADAVSLPDAARAVRARGRAMQKAVPVGQGGMLATLGLSDLQVETMLSWARAEGMPGVLEPANYNSPGQVVVSGNADACAWLQANFKADFFAPETPRFKLIPLKVSAPFHCSLMKPAELEMELVLGGTPFRNARWSIVQNVVATPVTAADELRANLVRQVCGSVRWTQCVQTLRDLGATKLIEFGAGKVLSGLSKKIDSENLTTFNTNSLEDLRAIEHALQVH